MKLAAWHDRWDRPFEVGVGLAGVCLLGWLRALWLTGPGRLLAVAAASTVAGDRGVRRDVRRAAGAGVAREPEPYRVRLLNRVAARTGTGGDNVGVRDVRVMFFGDSFVAGVGDDTGLGWVGRVVAGAFAAGVPVTAYNLGVRRETSAAVLERWEAEARPRVSPEGDCRVVFSFGANDATVENGSPRVSPADSVAGLSQAIAGAARLALPVLVVGPPPANDDDQQERIVRLSASFAEAAGDRGVPYVDVAGPLRASSTWIQEAQAGDGAHPGRNGYTMLAELVMEPWLAWLGGVATR